MLRDNSTRIAKDSDETARLKSSSGLSRFHKIIEIKSEEKNFPAWSFLVNLYLWIFGTFLSIVVAVVVSYIFSSSDAPLREAIDKATATIVDKVPKATVDSIRSLPVIQSQDAAASTESKSASVSVVSSESPLTPAPQDARQGTILGLTPAALIPGLTPKSTVPPAPVPKPDPDRDLMAWSKRGFNAETKKQVPIAVLSDGTGSVSDRIANGLIDILKQNQFNIKKPSEAALVVQVSADYDTLEPHGAEFIIKTAGMLRANWIGGKPAFSNPIEGTGHGPQEAAHDKAVQDAIARIGAYFLQPSR